MDPISLLIGALSGLIVGPTLLGMSMCFAKLDPEPDKVYEYTCSQCETNRLTKKRPISTDTGKTVCRHCYKAMKE